jgi:hypothetical protein
VLVALSAFGLGAHEPRNTPIEHFTAASPGDDERGAPDPAVDIAVTQWSTYAAHRALAAAFIEEGPLGFERLLCNHEPAGRISVAGAPATGGSTSSRP